MNYKEILQNEEVKAYLEKGNENLGILGYTDHSEKHCAIVAKRAGMILSKFGYTEHEIELAEIAGAMHDIGNVINRKNHGEYGAILACSILEKLKMPLRDRILVMSAIGNPVSYTHLAYGNISRFLNVEEDTPLLYSDGITYGIQKDREVPIELFQNYYLTSRFEYSLIQRR